MGRFELFNDSPISASRQRPNDYRSLGGERLATEKEIMGKMQRKSTTLDKSRIAITTTTYCRPSNLSTLVILFIYLIAKLNVYNHKTNCLDLGQQKEPQDTDSSKQLKPLPNANVTGATIGKLLTNDSSSHSSVNQVSDEQLFKYDLLDELQDHSSWWLGELHDWLDSTKHSNSLDESNRWNGFMGLVSDGFEVVGRHWMVSSLASRPTSRGQISALRRVHRSKRESRSESDTDDEVAVVAPKTTNATRMKLTSGEAAPERQRYRESQGAKLPIAAVATTPSGLTDDLGGDVRQPLEDESQQYSSPDNWANGVSDEEATTLANPSAIASTTTTSTTPLPAASHYDHEAPAANPVDYLAAQMDHDDLVETTLRPKKKKNYRKKLANMIQHRIPGPQQNPLEISDQIEPNDSSGEQVPQVGDDIHLQEKYSSLDQRRQGPEASLLDEQKRINQLIKLSEKILADTNNVSRRQRQRNRFYNDASANLTAKGTQDSFTRTTGAPYAPMILFPHSTPATSTRDYLGSQQVSQPTLEHAIEWQNRNRTPTQMSPPNSNQWHPAQTIRQQQQHQQQQQYQNRGHDMTTPRFQMEDNFFTNANDSKLDKSKRKLKASGSLRHANIVSAAPFYPQQLQPVASPISVSRQDLVPTVLMDQMTYSNVLTNQQQQHQSNPVYGVLRSVNPLGQQQQQFLNQPLPYGTSAMIQPTSGQQMNLLYADQQAGLSSRVQSPPIIRQGQYATRQGGAQFVQSQAAMNRFGSLLPNPMVGSGSKANTMPSKRQMNARSTNNRLTKITTSTTNYDEPSQPSNGNTGSAATTDPVWSDSQTQEDDYQQAPQTIQITAVPNGLVGNGFGALNGWNGVNGVNGWNGWGGPWNGRQVLLVNRQPQVGSGSGSEWRQWALPIAIILALPLVLGALFVPVFLKSVMFLIQILQMLGLLMPPHQLAGHLSSASHGSSSG